MNRCEYCNKEFTSVSNLNVHKKTAKYCLKLQNKDIIEYKFPCAECDVVCKTRSSFNIHQKRCIMNKSIVVNKFNELECKYHIQLSEKDNIIKDLRDKIILLEKQMSNIAAEIYEKFATKTYNTVEDIAKQPKTVTRNANNTTTNIINVHPMDFDPVKIKAAMENTLTARALLAGPEYVSDKMIDKIMIDEDGKSMYQTTDASRHVHKYKDEYGNIQVDKKCNKIYGIMEEQGFQRIVNSKALELEPEFGFETALGCRDKYEKNKFQNTFSNCVAKRSKKMSMTENKEPVSIEENISEVIYKEETDPESGDVDMDENNGFENFCEDYRNDLLDKYSDLSEENIYMKCRQMWVKLDKEEMEYYQHMV